MTQSLSKPKQDRSRATLTRLMEAAERLMSQKPFEKLTLKEIVAEAETTTGSFYARFKDKNAMLTALFEEHMRTVEDRLEETLKDLEGLPLRDQVSRIVSVIGEAFALRPALMRSGTLLFWNRDENGARLPEPMAPKQTLLGALEARFVEISRALGARDPENTARFALKITLASSRHHYLFTDERTLLTVTDGAFQGELSQMIYLYLCGGADQ